MMDLERFTDAQVTQAQTWVDHSGQRLHALTNQERIVYTSLWTRLAFANVPVTLASLRMSGVGDVPTIVEHLAQQGLIWYDDEMRAILQCPPFSALKSDHRVKAFGWKAAYTRSFVDAPLSLLLYGPNTWLDVSSVCQHSQAALTYRVRLDERHHLQTNAPPDADNWIVWVATDTILSAPGQRRLESGVFVSQADLDTYYQSHPQQAGTTWSFTEALYLSECLIHIWKQALSD